MASIQDIAAWIVESFDSRATLTIEEAIEKVLRDRGAPRFAASIDAAEKATRVSALLRSIRHGSFQAANVLTLRAGRAGNSAVVVDLLRRP